MDDAGYKHSCKLLTGHPGDHECSKSAHSWADYKRPTTPKLDARLAERLWNIGYNAAQKMGGNYKVQTWQNADSVLCGCSITQSRFPRQVGCKERKIRMKHTLTLALAILLLAATGWGETTTNYWNAVSAESNTYTVAESVTIGPVIISTTNGAVTIDEGITLDAASREFWKALEKEYGGVFPANDIRKLAASGEICKVFGHCWETSWIGVSYLVYCGDVNMEKRKCRICGKVETYNGEWK